jgi:hypothetical protein
LYEVSVERVSDALVASGINHKVIVIEARQTPQHIVFNAASVEAGIHFRKHVRYGGCLGAADVGQAQQVPTDVASSLLLLVNQREATGFAVARA